MISTLLPACILLFLLIFPSSVTAADVVINEFEVEPSSSQWVELYNTSASLVDISGWIIDDNGSLSTKFTIPQNTLLPSNTCITFTSGNFNFNTASSDSAQLFSGSTVIDVYSYTKSAGTNVSFGRSPDGTGEWITMTPSFGSFNISGDPCLAPATPTPTATPTVTPKPTVPPPSPTMTQSVPIVSATSTITPTRMSTIALTVSEKIVSTDREEYPDILGVEDGEEEIIESSSTGKTNDKIIRTKSLIIALLFISAGIGLFAIASLLTKVDIWNKKEKK